MRKPLLLVLATLPILAAMASACLGDEPMPTAPANDAGPASSVDAGTESDASTGTNQDAGRDAGSPSSCGTRDMSPCGCGGAKTCCVLENGTSPCQDRGNEDPDAGCVSTNLIGCVAGTCGGGQACCFLGDVTPAQTCPLRMTRFSSSCEPILTGSPENACTNTSNGLKHHFMCQSDADCTQFDAGTCHSALMDTVGRVMGICAP